MHLISMIPPISDISKDDLLDGSSCSLKKKQKRSSGPIIPATGTRAGETMRLGRKSPAYRFHLQ